MPPRFAWAVEQLDVRATGHWLEIGCGAGHALALLAPRLPRGCVTGIDRSAAQVKRARAANREAIDAGRVRVEHVALEAAPHALGERAFDGALAINVNAFWTSPGSSFPPLDRLLRPRALAFLVYEAPTPAQRARIAASLPVLAGQQGFAVRDARSAANRVCLVVSRSRR